MEKVCLVKAGKFLLGLNTSNIISTLSVDELKSNETNWNDSTFLFLESFLVQKDIDRSCSKIIVLKNKNNKKHLALLIDKILEEIKLPENFATYPLLYPELATKCCPDIFTHEDQIVLMLDPKQLNIIHKKLQTDHGSITLNTLIPVEKKIEREDRHQTDNENISAVEKETAQPKSKITIDDKTISSIASWIFDRYNNFYSDEKVIKLYSNEKIIISVDQLPPTLIQQQGLSDETLQQLIDKTIEQCEEARYKTMKDMIIDKLNDIQF